MQESVLLHMISICLPIKKGFLFSWLYCFTEDKRRGKADQMQLIVALLLAWPWIHAQYTKPHCIIILSHKVNHVQCQHIKTKLLNLKMFSAMQRTELVQMMSGLTVHSW